MRGITPAVAEEEKKTEQEQPAAEGEKKDPELEEKQKEEMKKEDPPAAETPQPPPPPELAQGEAPAIAQQAEKKMIKEIATTSSKISNDLELLSGHGAYDLVNRMPFLYVRVVKAKRPTPDPDSSVFAKLLIGTHTVKTKPQSDNTDWDQVFAFDKEGLNSTSLEISVWTEKTQEVKKEEANKVAG